MSPIRLRVEYQETNEMLQLRKELEQAHIEIERLKQEVWRAGTRSGDEIQINNQLIDLLRLHDIPFKPHLELKKRDNMV